MNLQQLKAQISTDLSQILAPEFGSQQLAFLNPQLATQGDFSTPICLKLAKQTHQNPLELAAKIAAQLPQNPYIQKVEAVAPGFINFFVSEQFLLEQLKQTELLTPTSSNEHIIIDYSSPNIAKPLGAHIILTTVIGQAAVNLNRACGNKVTAWNYLGDWGTQFGKLIYAYKQWGDRALIETDPINELLKLYVEFHNVAEEKPELEDFGRAEFKKLEDGDPENRELWQWVVEISKRDIQKVYKMLSGIEFDVYSGEADREQDLPVILKEGIEQGIFTKGENGSLIVDLEAEKLNPFLVQKSDGATLYSTRDIASVKTRSLVHNGTKLIYVVDVAQSLHFQQLFATVKKFDWFKPETELIHLKFGRMSFKDRKMSTRKGNIIHLETLIQEAISRAKEIILEKNPNLENLDEVARIVGVGSIKYSILSQSPETNVVFEWEKIISFEGNSAPYLQYCYARANSILAQTTLSDFNASTISANPEELELLKHLTSFQEIVEDACHKLKPHLLANYLFELCQKFNSFYSKSQVLNCPDQNLQQFRLNLVSKFCQTNKLGLNLLAGIEVPTKM